LFLNIKEIDKHTSINRLAKVFGYSRSSYYHYKYYRRKDNTRKAEIVKSMIKIYNNSYGTYGSPRITLALRREGYMVARRTIHNYMKELNIQSIVHKKFRYKKTNFKDYAYLRLKNIAKDTDVNDVNVVWTQDVTYIKLSDGTNAYLASVIDYYSRKVIAYELSRSMTTDLILRVLDSAYKERKPKKGIILHSDKGAQYRSDKYKDFAMRHGAVCSYTRIVFSCADNAGQESFHASLKKECLYQFKPQSFDDTKKIIFRYIDGFYNARRLHSAIGYKAPDEFEKELKISKRLKKLKGEEDIEN